jgi:hypothetical protein
MIEIPYELFVRLLAAIETPEDLTETDTTALLEDAQEFVR